jgi:hypothetical protein
MHSGCYLEKLGGLYRETLPKTASKAKSITDKSPFIVIQSAGLLFSQRPSNSVFDPFRAKRIKTQASALPMFITAFQMTGNAVSFTLESS